jgi:hypothetical protein
MLAAALYAASSMNFLHAGTVAPQLLHQYTAYCGLWRTDGSFQSTIRLRNSLTVAEVDAYVTLYMADGTAYTLPPVHLQKSAVATIKVNDALAQMPEAIAGRASTYGSATMTYTYSFQGAVYASMSLLDSIRSLQYNYSFTFPMEASRSTTQSVITPDTTQQTALEGLWWKFRPVSGGFIALANPSNADLSVQLSATDSTGAVGSSLTVTVPSRATKLISLRDVLGPVTSSLGGLRISYQADMDSIIVSAGLEDDLRGYSANLPLAIPAMSASGTTSQRYASVGIMTGVPDPMMNFPKKLIFTPYSYLRNIGPEPRAVEVDMNYTDAAGTPHSAPLTNLTLQPGQSSQLPSSALVRALPTSGDINLVFSWTGSPQDILMATGSVDQSGNYVFAVVPSAVAPSGSKHSVYWQHQSGFDTMYTIWNPDTKAEDLLVTLYFGKGANEYKVPLHLAAGVSKMVDIAALVMANVPDTDGHSLPMGPLEGHLVISGPKGDTADFINVVVSGGIYNPTLATCGYTCETCGGCNGNSGSFQVLPDPSSGTIGTQIFVTSSCSYSNGSTQYFTSTSSWSSSSTSVANFASPGTANALSAGSSTFTSDFPVLPINVGQICTQGTLPGCPSNAPSAQAPTVVKAPYQVGVLNTISSQANTCSSGAGWFREVTNQIEDQSGAPFSIQGTVSDSLTVGSPNDLGISGNQTGTGSTNAQGQWLDMYFDCSSVCPSSTGESDAIQQWSLNGVGLPKTNLVVYKCNSITINGQ